MDEVARVGRRQRFLDILELAQIPLQLLILRRQASAPATERPYLTVEVGDLGLRGRVARLELRQPVLQILEAELVHPEGVGCLFCAAGYRLCW